MSFLRACLVHLKTESAEYFNIISLLLCIQETEYITLDAMSGKVYCQYV